MDIYEKDYYARSPTENSTGPVDSRYVVLWYVCPHPHKTRRYYGCVATWQAVWLSKLVRVE